jgi:hypothetical protein
VVTETCLPVRLTFHTPQLVCGLFLSPLKIATGTCSMFGLMQGVYVRVLPAHAPVCIAGVVSVAVDSESLQWNILPCACTGTVAMSFEV